MYVMLKDIATIKRGIAGKKLDNWKVDNDNAIACIHAGNMFYNTLNGTIAYKVKAINNNDIIVHTNDIILRRLYVNDGMHKLYSIVDSRYNGCTIDNNTIVISLHNMAIHPFIVMSYLDHVLDNGKTIAESLYNKVLSIDKLRNLYIDIPDEQKEGRIIETYRNRIESQYRFYNDMNKLPIIE